MAEIVESAFQAFCALMQWIVSGFLWWIIEEFAGNKLTPSIEYFKAMLGVTSDGLLLIDVIIQTIEYASMFLILIIFIIILVSSIYGGFKESRDGIIELIVRSFFAVITTLLITDVLLNILQYGNGFFIEHIDTVVSQYLNHTEAIKNITANSIYRVGVGSSETTLVGEALASTVILPVIWNILRYIVQIIFFAIVCYNFLKLCAELVKRYMMICSLYILSPLSGAFLTCSHTQKVFVSYFSLYGTTVGIFILTKLWIQLCLYLMATVSCGVVEMLFLIALMQLGVKFESLAKEIGLSSLNMGGALLDSVMAAGATMIFMIKGASNATGNGLINVGGYTNNLGLSSVGSALTGKPMDYASRVKTMDSSLGAFARDIKGQRSGVSNFNNNVSKNLGEAIGRNGTFRNSNIQNTLSNLNPAGKQEALNSLLSGQFANMNQLIPAGYDTAITGYEPNAGFRTTIKDNLNDGLERNGVITDSPKEGFGYSSYRIENDDGSVSYLNLDPVSMDDLNNYGKAVFNDAGTIIGGEEMDNGSFGNYSNIELMTGKDISSLIPDDISDRNGENYALRNNGDGSCSLMYKPDGIDSSNINTAREIGAYAKDGTPLKTSTTTFADSAEVKKCFTNGPWSTLNFGNVTDVKLHENGKVTFTSTDHDTNSTRFNVAVPAVQRTDKAMRKNTHTSTEYGTYYFANYKNQEANRNDFDASKNNNKTKKNSRKK